jgi:AcrR family transcriptional regulator
MWYPSRVMRERLTRQEQKAQTRERLLDAATEVIAERGLAAASLDAIATAAGYTKGAVYSNFASKTDLVIALLERRIAAQSARLDTLDPASTTGQGTLDELPETERRFLVLVLEFWLHAIRDERARSLIAGQYERARTVVAGYLANAGYASTAPGGLTARDMAIVIEALGTGLGMQAALDPAHVKPDLMGRVLPILLAGVPNPGAGTAEAAPEG